MVILIRWFSAQIVKKWCKTVHGNQSALLTRSLFFRLPPRPSFLLDGQMVVIDSLTFEDLVPWSRLHIFATIFVPVDVWAFAQHVGFNKWTDVATHTIVQIWIPANGLLLNGLPTDEDVI